MPPRESRNEESKRRPFWKWHCWQSIGFYPYTKVLCYWSLGLIFKSKLKLESRNQKKSNMATRLPFWKWHHWRSIGFCPQPQTICTCNLKQEFQIKLELCLENHATYRVQRRKVQYGRHATNWKCRHKNWQASTLIHKFLFYWSLELIFKAKLIPETKNPIWPPGCHFTRTPLKINGLLHMATIIIHMTFETEIPKQTWLTLRKPCLLNR